MTDCSDYESSQLEAALTLTTHFRAFLRINSRRNEGHFTLPRLSLQVLCNLHITTLPQADILAHLHPHCFHYSRNHKINNGLLLRTADLDLDSDDSTCVNPGGDEFESFYRPSFRSLQFGDLNNWARCTLSARGSNLGTHKAPSLLGSTSDPTDQNSQGVGKPQLLTKRQPYFLEGAAEALMFVLRFELWYTVCSAYIDLPYGDFKRPRTTWAGGDHLLVSVLLKNGPFKYGGRSICKHLFKEDFLMRILRGLARTEQIELITMVLEGFMGDFKSLLRELLDSRTGIEKEQIRDSNCAPSRATDFDQAILIMGKANLVNLHETITQRVGLVKFLTKIRSESIEARILKHLKE